MAGFEDLTAKIAAQRAEVQGMAEAYKSVSQSISQVDGALRRVADVGGSIVRETSNIATGSALTTSTKSLNNAITTSTKIITDAIATASAASSGGGGGGGRRPDYYLLALNDNLRRQREILERMSSRFSNFANEWMGRR
jgi:hypothetical protein